MMRPIGLKFASLWTVVVLSGLTLLVQLIALGVLIPLWNDSGAAIGLAISSAVSMVFWLGIFEQFRRRPPAPAEIAAAGEVAAGDA
jgi:cation transporter-like permease